MAEEAETTLGSEGPPQSRKDLSLRLTSIEALRARLQMRRRFVVDGSELEGRKPSAVLVPMLARGDELNLVFTLRSKDLASHAGQISFPGGRRDEGDRDLVQTALREAEEELGIAPASVDVLGLLDDVATPSGYVVTPVVGVVTAPEGGFRANPIEVEEVFEVAVGVLRDPTLFEDGGMVERWGRMYRLVAYRPAGRNIWGVTGRIVHMLLEEL